MAKVFVTGGGGFLGRHIVNALSCGHHEVIALGRSAEALRNLESSPARLVKGDLMTFADWASALEGVEVVVHCAAATGLKQTRESNFRVNVEGTRIILNAAISSGVKRFVKISSVGVYGLHSGTFSEDAPLRKFGHPYSDTKIEAETLCRGAHERGEIAVTIIRPGLILGEGDKAFFPMFADMLMKKRLPLFDGGYGNSGIVDVKDVADLTVRAAFAPQSIGQKYNVVADETISWRELGERAAKHFKYPVPKLVIPSAPVRVLGAIMDAFSRARIVGDPPPISHHDVNFLACNRIYSITKAKSDLGYSPSPLDDTLWRTFDDFSAHCKMPQKPHD